jgi:flagellar motor switch protein FliM
MTRILSQDEIDALLLTAEKGAPEEPVAEATATTTIQPYNFRRPDRVSKDQLRALHFLHDRFAVNLSTSLSAFLRSVTEVSITSVEQFAYSEFLMSLPDPTAFYAIALPPVDTMGALELNPSIAFTMIDRMLGGSGETMGPDRALTEIEQNVLDAVVDLVLQHLTETWKAIVDVDFRVHARETRPQMLQVTSANEIMILLGFDVRIGEARGMLSICIPASAIESMEDKVTQGWHRQPRTPTDQEQMHLRVNLGRLPLPITALIETQLLARDLVDLEPGDVIALGRSASEPIDVHVGRIRRFAGRLTRNQSAATVRIESLSGEGAGSYGAVS